MHLDWLIQTLELAKVRKGFCAPNPSVGAVVVKDDKCLSSASHFKAGDEHAEFQALRQLNYPLTGATLYISLEPCSHWGKTPPCVDEIVNSGISKVVYAYSDPNPLVEPFDTIGFFKKNNIECEQIEVLEITEFYSSYKYWFETKRPFVTVKIAQSLNGKTCLANSESVALTGEQMSQFTHLQRKQSDMILTSARTVINDDPKFTARIEGSEINKPIGVLDSKLKLISDKKFQCEQNIKTIFYDKSLNLANVSSQHIGVSNKNGLNLDEILTQLGQQGIHNLWVEAGGKLTSAFLKAKLVNRLYVYISPCWLGEDCLDAYINRDKLDDSDYKSVTWQSMGKDMMMKLEF